MQEMAKEWKAWRELVEWLCSKAELKKRRRRKNLTHITDDKLAVTSDTNMLFHIGDAAHLLC